jgi:hypothetical protein
MKRRRSSSATAAAEIEIEAEACQIANEAHRLRMAGLEAQLAALDRTTAQAPPAGEQSTNQMRG